ncbi:uncharacterized protein LOC135225771 [Macrobrachium nipponense]|uniref:uncharacterized protein LOC135225771 n=1 Tax=Macrobrachium nipponense TaxID=159736 RepID=UPI0030C7C598
MEPETQASTVDVLSLLRNAIDRVTSDVARELYTDERIGSECGVVPLREYCHRGSIWPNFENFDSSLLDSNLLTLEFDADLAFVIIEEVCVGLYNKLSEGCVEGLHFLKFLSGDIKGKQPSNNEDLTKCIEEFQIKIKAIYKGVSQVVDKDLNKNLLTIDQMANNILNRYRYNRSQSEPTSPKLEKDVPVYIRQTSSPHQESRGKKLWKRNSKLTVSIIQEKPSNQVSEGKEREEKNLDLHKQEKKTKGVAKIDKEAKTNKSSNLTQGKKFPERVLQGFNELEEYYLRIRNFNACSWYKFPSKDPHTSHAHIPLEEIFTNVRIRNGSREVEMREIFSQANEDVNKDASPQLVLIQGLAGSGKTSLCYHFVFEWLRSRSEVNDFSEFDFVVLIEACRVRSSRLREFLRDELLFHSTSNMESEDIIPWLKTLNILFIFDGYYETENVSYDIIEDVLAKFSNQQVIITTRPEVHHDFVCMARRHLTDYCSLELCGFDVPRLEDFTNKVFRIIDRGGTPCKTQSEAFLSYINGRGRVLDKHLKLPLTILLLIFLWKNEPDIFNKDTSATQLYEELYILYFNILEERTSKYFQGISQISHILGDLLLFIGKMAWDMVKSGTTVISDTVMKSIREECEGRGIRVRELMSALHLYQIDNNSSICKLPVAFQHSTQMYYLAATFLVDRLQRRILELQNIEACPDVEHVLMFVMGHLASQNALTNALVTEVFQIVDKLSIDSTKYDFWWSFLSESKFHSQVAHRIAKEKLPLKLWHLNEANVVRGLKLLAMTPFKLWSLIVDIPDNKEPFDIPEFLESFIEAGKQINKRQKRIVKIDLHLRHHEKSSNKYSDDFLRALHPWADLLGFTGHLGHQQPGEEVFASYFNLSTIHVKVSTMDSFSSLAASLKKIHKAVKTLHVTIALPKSSPPELMTALKTSGNLEISVGEMEDQHREWLVEVINRVCGRNGCWRLNLLRSRLTYDTVEWLVTQLKGRVHDKLNVETKE